MQYVTWLFRVGAKHNINAMIGVKRRKSQVSSTPVRTYQVLVNLALKFKLPPHAAMS